MNYLLGSLFSLFTVTLAGVGAAHAQPPEKPVSIVLVHGAFVDGSGWQATYEILTGHGYEVLVVQNSTASLTGDVDETKRVIARARHPVILVAHSYGGAVITQAGNDPKVERLVYFSAFAPDVGETVFQLATKPVPGEPGPPLLPPSDGQLLVDPAKFPDAFALGVDPRLTHFMAIAQVPWGMPAVETPIDTPAWRSKPSFFMIASQDRMIPPTTLRMMAKRAGGTTVEIGGPHAMMLTHPAEVAAFIERAATSVAAK
ncbi:alpha/beta fold hydrolase [Sphingomonas sp.]|uniref:alpha/beta fold hydrolase n=1 Tax=Sphingomonas sp. TaxID=28214 RepID=UPI003B3A98CA